MSNPAMARAYSATAEGTMVGAVVGSSWSALCAGTRCLWMAHRQSGRTGNCPAWCRMADCSRWSMDESGWTRRRTVWTPSQGPPNPEGKVEWHWFSPTGVVTTRREPVGGARADGEGPLLANASHAKLGLGAPRGEPSERAEHDRDDRGVWGRHRKRRTWRRAEGGSAAGGAVWYRAPQTDRISGSLCIPSSFVSSPCS